MSLVQKIPSMVSALAFGYGVGMAAPESTMTSVRATVAAPQAHSASSPSLAAAPPPLTTLPRTNAAEIAGNESRELARLRVVATREGRREGGEACDLEQPTYSKTPRYESRADRETFDPDDLDTAGAEALSRLQLPDMRVPVTRRTVKYVRFFTRTERGRGMFETWLKRSGRFQELIQTELRDHRLPEDLMWVAMIESGFDPRAKSPAGAVGLWQFMPATGGVYGLEQDHYIDQRKNPRLATKAAVHHLRDLYQRFGGWDLALAAYNMGYEQLLDAIDQYGTADFNELARQQAIPKETASYVPKITAAAIVANNLEHFGFDKVELSRPVDAAEIPVPPGTPLKILAKAAGVATAAVRSLNPDILGERVPPGHGDYILYVPADTVSRARAAMPAMLENEPLVGDDAQILDGVDLLKARELSRRHSKSDDESLLSLLPHPRRHGSLRAPEGDDDGAVARDDDDAAPSVDDDADGPHRSLGHRSRRRRATVVYRVGPGDTIAGVAQQFGIQADEVAHQNRLDDGDRLKVGTLLKLKVRAGALDDLAAGEGDAAKDKDEKAGKARSRHEAHKKARDAT
jgi:membrane-bound lytic murein transglycosylase D